MHIFSVQVDIAFWGRRRQSLFLALMTQYAWAYASGGGVQFVILRSKHISLIVARMIVFFLVLGELNMDVVTFIYLLYFKDFLTHYCSVFCFFPLDNEI